LKNIIFVKGPADNGKFFNYTSEELPCMSTTTYLITGAARGLGLETARQLLALLPSNRVIAAARSPKTAKELQALIEANPGRIAAVTLDVGDPKSIQRGIAEVAALDLAKDGIDVLHNNAGIVGEGNWATATQLPISNLEALLRINLIGTVNVTLAALPLLRAGKGKKIFTTSSIVGSIGGPLTQASPRAAGSAHYAVSKAAIDMYFVKLSKELGPEGFTIVMFHPVSTDMNHGRGDISKEESVEQTIKNIFLGKGPAENGKFFYYTSEEIPW
ncbi:hypothetical protein MNV49_003378, partial [Pseudohyphozyma bogoriensis]